MLDAVRILLSETNDLEEGVVRLAALAALADVLGYFRHDPLRKVVLGSFAALGGNDEVHVPRQTIEELGAADLVLLSVENRPQKIQ
jgi:hypothetical protein